MKLSRSEHTANLGLIPMQNRQQYKGTIQKISKPKSGFRIVAETLFYCAFAFATVYLFVYAVFN